MSFQREGQRRGEKVMFAAMRMVMAVAVLVLPGAFPIVLAFLAVRSMRTAYLKAQVPGSEANVLRAVFGGLRMRALLNEARAVAFQPVRIAA